MLNHGTENDYKYLIIDRLASSLDDLFQLWYDRSLCKS